MHRMRYSCIFFVVPALYENLFHFHPFYGVQAPQLLLYAISHAESCMPLRVSILFSHMFFSNMLEQSSAVACRMIQKSNGV